MFFYYEFWKLRGIVYIQAKLVKDWDFEMRVLLFKSKTEHFLYDSGESETWNDVPADVIKRQSKRQSGNPSGSSYKHI